MSGTDCLPKADDPTDQQGCCDSTPEDQGTFVPPRKLPEPVKCTRGYGDDGFMAQITLNVLGEAAGGLIAAITVLFERFHYNPVKLPMDQPVEPRRLDPPLLSGGA